MTADAAQARDALKRAGKAFPGRLGDIYAEQPANTAPPCPKPERDYSETLFLPQTEFPMRAGLPQREPEILARWEKIDLYEQLREAAKGRDEIRPA